MGKQAPELPFGDLARQYRALQPVLDDAVRRVMASGWYVLGDEVRRFEEEFARALEVPFVITCANGTDAIVLTLLALGVKHGDEVVVPAMTAMPTATAVLQVGAKPVFADVDAETALVTAETIDAVISPDTKAIVAVHLYGQSCRMGPIRELASRRRVAVIEDAAQAHGARDGGSPAGRLADAITFSFYPTKNLGALGDGGAVAVSDPERAGLLRSLRDYGQRGRYEHERFGINSRLDEIQAAILRAKLPHLSAWNERRRTIAARYDAALVGNRGIQPFANLQGEGHVRHLYAVRCADRERVRALLHSRGIGTSIHYPKALPDQTVLRGARGNFEVARHLASHILSLPIYPELTDSEVSRVVEALRENS